MKKRTEKEHVKLAQSFRRVHYKENQEKKDDGSSPAYARKDIVLMPAKQSADALCEILEHPKFRESVLKSDHFTSELHKYGFDYDQLPDGSPLKKIVEAFSDFFESSKKKLNTRNPEIGQFNKDNADNFVENLTQELQKVEAEGFTSTRKLLKDLMKRGYPLSVVANGHIIPLPDF